MSEAHKYAHAGITLAPLDPADVREGEAAGVGYLLLRQAAFGADSEDASAEAVERIAGHGGCRAGSRASRSPPRRWSA